MSPHNPLGLTISARYNAGNPIPRPQSLANTIALESNSQAGDSLLQFPPVSCRSAPVATLRSQICLGPLRSGSNAIHCPSHDGTESATSAGDKADVAVGKARGATRRVAGSNAMVVETPCETSSK